MDILYTKESLIVKLKEIRQMGWIENHTRKGNTGAVGNILEDLLGIQENNFALPNAGEWELKCQSSTTKSLTTLFHLDPSPRNLKIVTRILLPYYGWRHKEAGKKHSDLEKSFRQTLYATRHTDGGFTILVDKKNEKLVVSFDAKSVSSKHTDWLKEVENKVGLGDLNPQPYWGFEDLYHVAGSKLHNCFFILAEKKTDKAQNKEYFYYSKIFKLIKIDKYKFIQAIELGDICIDFDARTGHNHGTKFRFKNNRLPELYEDVEEII